MEDYLVRQLERRVTVKSIVVTVSLMLASYVLGKVL